MKKLVPLVLVICALVLSACSTATAPPAWRASACPDGHWLVANLWSFKSLPAPIQKEVAKMMAMATSRDTRGATNPIAYRGDSVSRTVGALLRKFGVRAPINLDLEIFYRDPRGMAKVVYNLGILPVEAGIGSIRLPKYAGNWIVEAVWPDNFISPIRSGGKNRLWVPPEDWEEGKHCSMNIHGIVP